MTVSASFMTPFSTTSSTSWPQKTPSKPAFYQEDGMGYGNLLRACPSATVEVHHVSLTSLP